MNEFKKTFTSITKNVTKMSGEFIKTTKINLAISGEEDNLKNVYIDIGKKVHEIYMFGGSIGKFFDEKYAEISDIEKKLAELRGQLSIASGTKTCPKCNKSVEKFAEFCPGCGTRMTADAGYEVAKPVSKPEPSVPGLPADPPMPVMDPTVSAPPAPPSPPVRICNACGAECSDTDKYCLSCGRML